MQRRAGAACALAAMVVQPVMATAAGAQAVRTEQIQVGGQPTKAVGQVPVDRGASPEAIAADAARDLKDNRFYNKPGATRAQYNADWQECRLIARGSRTPAGTIPYSYNPALVSPLAAGIAGGIGGLIAGAIAEGQQRRANRRSCLLIRGWRLVELPAPDAARVAAMPDAERAAYWDRTVGAATVAGNVTERTSFSLAPDPGLNLDGAPPGPGSVWMGKKVDPAAPLVLGPDEAALVLAYRRPDAGSAGRAGKVAIARYDPAHGDLVYRPKDWKKTGDKTTYLVEANSADKKSPLEVQVVKVTPGSYVINGTAVGPMIVNNTNCFGAPTFTVKAGQVAYLGDFVPLWKARTAAGEQVNTLAYTSHVEDARRVLAGRQPALAAAMTPAVMRNGATYACSAVIMDRWDLPGVETLPPGTLSMQ